MISRIKNAYTLPELLITVLLLAILLSLGIVFSSIMAKGQKNKSYAVALAFAQQAIELARGAPFEILSSSDAGEASVEYDLNNKSSDNDLLIPTLENGEAVYTRTVKIRDIKTKDDPDSNAGLKHISVKVEWISPENNKPDTLEINSLIANIN
ncbi:MAG: prepilin-type N-terminal cleavage/methylation domain-containing protein [Candidatus Riflebacteria bacterium]|nr:prepilin-type N-terminal cleavage/methylation domain-containing protein [Candidatus Riflebacteria bacterium]